VCLKYEKEPFAAINFGNCRNNILKKSICGSKFCEQPRKYEKVATCGCKFQKLPRKFEKKTSHAVGAANLRNCLGNM
jgi:hypothetical protein